MPAKLRCFVAMAFGQKDTDAIFRALRRTLGPLGVNAQRVDRIAHYPVIDGYVVPDDPSLLLGTKRQENVPLIIGHNTAEGLFFARDAVTTISAYRDFVRASIPAGFVDEVLARYPAASDADAASAQQRLFADFRIVTPTTLTARTVSKAGWY